MCHWVSFTGQTGFAGNPVLGWVNLNRASVIAALCLCFFFYFRLLNIAACYQSNTIIAIHWTARNIRWHFVLSNFALRWAVRGNIISIGPLLSRFSVVILGPGYFICCNCTFVYTSIAWCTFNIVVMCFGTHLVLSFNMGVWQMTVGFRRRCLLSAFLLRRRL